MKVMGMLVVSLRGANCRFWSHLGVQDRKPIFVLMHVLLSGNYERKLKNYDNASKT